MLEEQRLTAHNAEETLARTIPELIKAVANEVRRTGLTPPDGAVASSQSVKLALLRNEDLVFDIVQDLAERFLIAVIAGRVWSVGWLFGDALKWTTWKAVSAQAKELFYQLPQDLNEGRTTPSTPIDQRPTPSDAIEWRLAWKRLLPHLCSLSREDARLVGAGEGGKETYDALALEWKVPATRLRVRRHRLLKKLRALGGLDEVFGDRRPKSGRREAA